MARPGRFLYGDLGRMLAFAWGGLRGMSPSKMINAISGQIEKFRRVSCPTAAPCVAVLDVTNVCNLKCPYCPTGSRRESGRQERFIKLSEVQRLVDEIGQYLISANLYNWGEPLLHPQIGEIIRTLRRRKIFTVLSTNLNIADQKKLEEVSDAELDYMVVSISGATQEVYEKYHAGGKLQLVMENIRHLTRYKRSRRVRRPLVEVKFLTFSHNIHQLDGACRLARESGADVFRRVTGGGPEDAVIVDQHHSTDSGARFCHQLWHSIVLTPDQRLAPCCFLFFREDDLGDCRGKSFLEVRRNSSFTLARKLFDVSQVSNLPSDLRHPCLKCDIVHRQPHLREYLRSNPHAGRAYRTGGP